MKRGHCISTEELEKVTAGGRDYIRTKHGEVKGLALRLDLNPLAPEVIVVGRGPNIESRARSLIDSGAAVPAYVKRDTNRWVYRGLYQAIAYRQERAVIRRYCLPRSADEVAGILFLEAVGTAANGIRGRTGNNPELRKKVEVAAINYVKRHLRKEGYRVRDCQRDNCGYDLLAETKNEELRIEVKGTDGPLPRFFISRNERASSLDDAWRLAVVMSATIKPEMLLLTRIQAEEQFDYDPLAWECTLRRT